jgi:hypothetical protein
MTRIKRGLTAFCVLLLFAATITAQNVSEQYCKQIEDSVIKKLNPMKIDRQEVYSDECVFEFTVADDVDVKLRVEKYDTEEDSHQSLDRALSLTASFLGLESKEELPLDGLETDNSWDEVYFSKATKMNSGSLLLRKGKFAITILSLKDELLIQMEKMLRNEIDCKVGAVTPLKN